MEVFPMTKKWPNGAAVAQVRVARPTNQLTEIKRFYCRGLGLQQIGSFQGHRGYQGIMIGLPDSSYHLEIIQHESGQPVPSPTKEDLFVFYIPQLSEMMDIKNRLHSLGYHTVSPENPYWEEKGFTFEDPDGWRVVLMNTSGI